MAATAVCRGAFQPAPYFPQHWPGPAVATQAQAHRLGRVGDSSCQFSPPRLSGGRAGPALCCHLPHLQGRGLHPALHQRQPAPPARHAQPHSHPARLTPTRQPGNTPHCRALPPQPSQQQQQQQQQKPPVPHGTTTDPFHLSRSLS